MEEFIRWLRRHRLGTKIRVRDIVVRLMGFMGVLSMYATLSARIFWKDGRVEDLGVVSLHEVTDDFVEALVDTLQSSVAAFSDFKYHDTGTDDTIEDPTDSGLVAPCGDARTVGTQVEGATANIYKSVATHTYGGSYAIKEHGLFNAAAAGVLMDRSVLTAVINMEPGDKIEWSYSLSCVSGG